MAILITARKVSEDAVIVRYEFGLDERFDRVLTINKASGSVSADDGSLDSVLGMMSVKIKKISRASGEFPRSAIFAG